jgi:hypothetical protein
MKSERIRNHGAHITYTLQLLSSVLYTLRSVPVARVCCVNLQPAAKLLVTMDSVSSVMIPSLAHSVINSSHSACISFTIRVYAFSVIFLASPESSHCKKVDCHQLCRKPGQSRLSCFFCLKSWFGNCQSWSQASLSGDESSHDHPFILRVFVTPKFSVALPYCDEPVVIIVTASTRSCTKSLRGTWGPAQRIPKVIFSYHAKFLYRPSNRYGLRISLSICSAKGCHLSLPRAEQTRIAP